MYTYVVPNCLYPEDYSKAVVSYGVDTIEKAYNAFVNSPFTCKILDFDGSEMSKNQMEERLAGKTHIVQVYFPALDATSFEKRHVWFKASRNVQTFTSVRITGSDRIIYDGIIVDEADVKILPARMGKKTLS